MPPQPDYLIQKAFSLIEEARGLENVADNPPVRGGGGDRALYLERSAAKYSDAVFYLKNYARRLVRTESDGSNSSGASANTRDLIVENIDRYETRAADLMAEVESSRLEDERRQRREREELARVENLRLEDERRQRREREEEQQQRERQRRDDGHRRNESGVSTSSWVVDQVEELKRKIQGIDTDRSTSPKLASSRRHSNANQPDKLTRDEIEVLKWSSRIASGLFLPWMDEEARSYNYSPAQPWIDPDGLLKLSEKQEERFCKWARPTEILAMRGNTPSSPTMIDTITPYTIKQYCVSDCSFIAGLCISAEFERPSNRQLIKDPNCILAECERLFNRRLIKSLIHPQDPNGMPTYNRNGVYMVKLWFNGVERRVLVDDLLPVDDKGELLCSHTKNNDGCLELWVPILEKAYMKLCGGYDFPGSNSGVDLFCLTGWIPESIILPENPNDVRDFETPAERAWDRLYNAYSFGDCLATVSTSKALTEEKVKKVGLFTGHAYAVLKIVWASNGTKLLQLKNPWASKGWKGRFSAHDTQSWSDPAFCKEVGYDIDSVATYDDGVFWMSWDDLLLYLCNIHVLWRPGLFRV
ncbi:hypothetical protein ACHAW5_002879 [Stephanodiscus triporus]|uniref:Calpain catalytic domain-containing protein n=1 Tax=Stephanodiscus triporus TaxID=2934178 RepID=A0ABD3MYD9_9STRA